jgi:hypothetical protein
VRLFSLSILTDKIVLVVLVGFLLPPFPGIVNPVCRISNGGCRRKTLIVMSRLLEVGTPNKPQHHFTLTNFVLYLLLKGKLTFSGTRTVTMVSTNNFSSNNPRTPCSYNIHV